MKINIKSPNLEITEAMRVYMEKKVKSFERPISKYLVKQKDIEDNPIESRKTRVEIFWEVGTKFSGVKKGLFFCKGEVIIPGKEGYLRAYIESGNLYDAIDQVKDIIVSQIVEIKDKSISIQKKASRKVQRDLREKEGERVEDESA